MASYPALFPWYGGKAEHLKWILPLLDIGPAGYVEPFAGAGSVFFARKPARFEVLNDLNGRLIHFLRTLRDEGEELQQALRLTMYSREEHEAAIEDDLSLPDVERARRTFVIWRQNFGGGGIQANTWGRQLAEPNGSPKAPIFANRVNMLDHYIGRLKNAQIESKDAIEIIHEYGSRETNLLYCDPPYVHGSRKTNKTYIHEMDDAVHLQLLKAVIGCKARVAVSGYNHPLYDEHIGHWRKHEEMRLANFRKDGHRAKRTEILWMNYDPNGEVEQYDFLG